MSGNPIRYVIAIDKSDDLIIEDPGLTLELTPGWAIFNDTNGIALALPAERIRHITRLDQPPGTDTDGP